MEITDPNKHLSYSQVIFNQLLSIPDGQRFKDCLQCGTCAGVCPFGAWMDYAPRKMIATIRFDDFKTVLNTDSV